MHNETTESSFTRVFTLEYILWCKSTEQERLENERDLSQAAKDAQIQQALAKRKQEIQEMEERMIDLATH